MEENAKNYYSPQVKRLLKMYQNFADHSLSGPDELHSNEGCKVGPKEKSLSVSDKQKSSELKKSANRSTGGNSVHLSLEILERLANMPVLVDCKHSEIEKRETLIEGELITCFTVGGEARLCLPQLLKTVLGNFSLEAINSVCETLDISCSRCNAEQLSVLKTTGVLPCHAPSCGLLTKTNAERLCHTLLHQSSTKVQKHSSHHNSFKVYHECFGKCKGIFMPALYLSEESPCIECCECNSIYSPAQFVCHAHRSLENRTCHWGFESSKWRTYLMLARGQGYFNNLQEYFDNIKNLHLKGSQLRKRKQTSDDLHSVPKRNCTADEAADLSSKLPIFASQWKNMEVRDNNKLLGHNTEHKEVQNMNYCNPSDAGLPDLSRRLSQLVTVNTSGGRPADDVILDLVNAFDKQHDHICLLTKENTLLNNRLQQMLVVVEHYRTLCDTLEQDNAVLKGKIQLSATEDYVGNKREKICAANANCLVQADDVEKA